MVETRLLYEAYEDETEQVAAEFLCSQGAHNATMEIQSLNDPQFKVMASIEKGRTRRWVVRKVFLDSKSPVKVERWSVKSSVDYKCTPGESHFNAPRSLCHPIDDGDMEDGSISNLGNCEIPIYYKQLLYNIV